MLRRIAKLRTVLDQLQRASLRHIFRPKPDGRFWRERADEVFNGDGHCNTPLCFSCRCEHYLLFVEERNDCFSPSRLAPTFSRAPSAYERLCLHGETGNWKNWVCVFSKPLHCSWTSYAHQCLFWELHCKQCWPDPAHCKCCAGIKQNQNQFLM